jgi:CRP-like cAMP-binding protein
MLSGLERRRKSEGAVAVRAPRAQAVQNKLLRLLPAEELSDLLSLAETVELRPRQVLQHWKLPMEHVYFPESGLVSVAAKVANEQFVEVWLIGSDGFVGVPLILTPQAEPLHRRTVQIRGEALRIPSATFRQTSHRFPVLHGLLNRYLAYLLVQTSQSGACNLRHPVKQRLARWLLLARDALGADEIPLTHDVLSQLLGVRRASVTERLEDLRAEGLISTRRHYVRIERAEGLERISCDCFGLIAREYQRQFGSCSSSRHASIGFSDHESSAHRPIWP